MRIEKGEYHPRIWRNGSHYPSEEHYLDDYCSFAESCRIILGMLGEVFQTIEPSCENQEAYGLKIRHLLLLACTEIESAWIGILKANAYQKKPNYTTHDYVRLMPVMKLERWCFELRPYKRRFPDEIRPFGTWSFARPTKSLSWYDAYNSVKHDRDHNFEKASLLNAIFASAGLLAMGFAQFGPSPFRHRTEYGFRDELFWPIDAPRWSRDEQYQKPKDGDDWSALKYNF